MTLRRWLVAFSAITVWASLSIVASAAPPMKAGTEWAATGKVTQKVPDDFPGPDAPVLRQ